MVDRFATLARRGDKHRQIIAQRALADELGQSLRPQIDFGTIIRRHLSINQPARIAVDDRIAH